MRRGGLLIALAALLAAPAAPSEARAPGRAEPRAAGLRARARRAPAGRYPEAAGALAEAMQAGPDPPFVLAPGVAQCLGEQLAPAIADFERAKRSGLRGREADLWTYAAKMMSRGQIHSADVRGSAARPAT